MQTAVQHLTSLELEHGLAEVLESPRDDGRLETIVVRPESDKRLTPSTARLTVEGGVEGDRWVRDSYYKLSDGRSDPCCQVSLMNARFLRQIAGSDDAVCFAGDNLVVNFDLSAENLPPGSRLAIGECAVIEITDKPHTGCEHLARRYGEDARQFMNNARGKSLHLRGRYARVIAEGTVAVGDVVRKVGGDGDR